MFEERRIFERFSVDFPVAFSCSELKIEQGTGKMIDISASGGGMFITKHDLPLKAHLEMNLKIPDDHDPFTINGIVVWSKKIKEDVFRIGVKFDKVDFMGVSRALRLRSQNK